MVRGCGKRRWQEATARDDGKRLQQETMIRGCGKRRWQEATARDDGKRLWQRGYGKRLQTDIIRKKQTEIIRKDQERTAAII
jgi:hypothetical protein